MSAESIKLIGMLAKLIVHMFLLGTREREWNNIWKLMIKDLEEILLSIIFLEEALLGKLKSITLATFIHKELPSIQTPQLHFDKLPILVS